MITHEDLLDARLIEALDAGDLDTALRLWSETSSSPGQEERFYALVKNWAAEPEPVALGIRAAELISGFPGTTGLRFIPLERLCTGPVAQADGHDQPGSFDTRLHHCRAFHRRR